MQVFIVIGADPRLASKIIEVYTDHHYHILSCHAWAIGATHKTVSDVAHSLGMSEKSQVEGVEGVAGIVVQADYYNGWYSLELWEKCRLWEQSDG